VWGGVHDCVKVPAFSFFFFHTQYSGVSKMSIFRIWLASDWDTVGVLKNVEFHPRTVRQCLLEGKVVFGNYAGTIEVDGGIMNYRVLSLPLPLYLP
jgi:hypothetical protein